MIEIRIHGRGGQGSVTAAELLAEAAFIDKKFSQAFPFFGIERRGAPVEAYVRLSKKPIQLRSQIYEPDFIIIQDATLAKLENTFRGIKRNTSILINSEKIPNIKFIPKGINIKTIPATQIALEILKKPIINTVMLGAFVGAFGIIKPLSLCKTIEGRFKKEIAEKNLKAMNTAYCHTNPHDKYCYEAEKCKIALDLGEKFSVEC